ncbi:uncharacterized protein BJ171DRAFT_555220 [Polychytrium aggregatum]|uniref:uncharacterized protein n=1 Tax=Polychytrium aggregatum TaxID=110093 RepID=UPI0022FE0253|nr:uncharacterized protein BJ171DRAFT_555220 [Polychytrium aggregatum]KAI9179336.1 hypothetical protein BJ171DRAFT_555220 [Polychytrium aggregatum]
MKAVPIGCYEFMTPIRDTVLASGNDMSEFMAWSKDIATIDSKNREIESQNKQFSLDAYKTVLECIKGVEDKTTAFGILDRAEAFIYGSKRTKLSDPEDTQPSPSTRPTTPTPPSAAVGVEELPDEQPAEHLSFQKLDIEGLKAAFATPVDNTPGNFKTIPELIAGVDEFRAFFDGITPQHRMLYSMDRLTDMVIDWFDGIVEDYGLHDNFLSNWRVIECKSSKIFPTSYYAPLHPFILVLVGLYVFKRGTILTWTEMRGAFSTRVAF